MPFTAPVPFDFLALAGSPFAPPTGTTDHIAALYRELRQRWQHQGQPHAMFNEVFGAMFGQFVIMGHLVTQSAHTVIFPPKGPQLTAKFWRAQVNLHRGMSLFVPDVPLP